MTSTCGSNFVTLKNDVIKLGIINNYDCFIDIKVKAYKNKRRYNEVKPEDRHKIPKMHELLMLRDWDLYIDDDNFEINDVAMMINELAAK